MEDLTWWQWRRWKAWMAIRGPIGGPRQDAYALMQAAFTAGPGKEPVVAADFMPWAAKDIGRPPPQRRERRSRRRVRVAGRP